VTAGWLRLALAVLIAGAWGAQAAAQSAAPPASPALVAPHLGVATRFGQGWRPDLLPAAVGLGADDFRDAVYWNLVEAQDGTLSFTGDRTAWPDRLPPLGATMSLTVNNGHPAHDGGATPHSPPAVAAFADFAAAAVRRFPAIRAVEIGNEMNSDRFMTGPLAEGDLAARARGYAALLAASAARVRRADPTVRILGGAAHSIPLAWIEALLRAGAAASMDALVLHPYTTAPEQLRRQIALLRRLPGAATLPIEITEFGSTDATRAPGLLLRHYCQMALSGVTRAVWYPLAARGDGLVPLVDDTGLPTPAGRTFRTIRQLLEGTAGSDASPDPFTYGCRFGPRALLLWGEPRALTLAPGLQALDPEGMLIAQPDLSLSMERPVLILGAEAPPVLGENVRLAPQRILADSLHQFAYPVGGAPVAFRAFMRLDGQEEPLETRPGQDRPGVPWTPYLASDRDGVLRAGPGWVVPSAWGDRPLSVVLRHRVESTTDGTVTVRIAPSERSTDGVRLTLRLGGAILLDRVVRGPETLLLAPVRLVAGNALEVELGPNGSAKGDATDLRVTISE